MPISIIILFVLIMWILIFTISFALFRISLRRYTTQIAASIALLSIASIIIQVNKWYFLTGTLQIMMLYLCLNLILKFNWQHSLIVSVFGYTVSGLFEPLSAFIMSNYQLDQAIQIWQQNNPIILSLVLKSIFQLAFFYLLLTMRWGFTFIQPTSKRLIKLTLSTTLIFIAFIALTLSLSFILYLQNVILMYVICAILFLLLHFLYLAYQRELAD
jgi:hypothetical protein